ncbi:RNA polymerase sigma factor [Telmatobacter bradus]|uniref:RNA polymerase sigma factor n=1 Tax=Telmatobacter bradus TaxID=474953 RepID=UPI003B42FB36
MRAQLKEALDLLHTGDSERIGEALAILQGTVFAFSMKVCGHREDAEDTMQEVLLRSLSHLAKIEHPRALAVWLYTVTRNRCWRSRRKLAHAPKEFLSLEQLMPDRDELQQLLEDKSSSPEENASRVEEAQFLHRAVLTLPAVYRIVLVLHDMEELDNDLVSEILGIQPGTVRVRLHRARLAVRKAMALLLQGHSPDWTKPVRSARKKNRKQDDRNLECRSIFNNLSELLDHRIKQPSCAQIEQHIQSCPPCVAFLKDLSHAIDRCRRFEVEGYEQLNVQLGNLLVAEYLRLTKSVSAETDRQ